MSTSYESFSGQNEPKYELEENKRSFERVREQYVDTLNNWIGNVAPQLDLPLQQYTLPLEYFSDAVGSKAEVGDSYSQTPIIMIQYDAGMGIVDDITAIGYDPFEREFAFNEDERASMTLASFSIIGHQGVDPDTYRVTVQGSGNVLVADDSRTSDRLRYIETADEMAEAKRVLDAYLEDLTLRYSRS